ncbi:MAG: hypothetical protein HQ575_06905 [Candidatus Omnitrophica bacterium]|nr:hypothetical protein [Candidatus Omnitrophota bacterium]
MSIDKPARMALLFSIGFHSILFSPLLNFSTHPINNNTTIEVTYIYKKEEIPSDTKPIPLKAEKTSLQKEKMAIKIEGKSSEKKGKAIEKIIEKAVTKNNNELREILLSEKALDLNSLTEQDGTSDALNYLRSIRNEINAYIHRKYSLFMGEGEAVLHFALNQDGTVRSASIIKDYLGNNVKLRNLCMDSVYFSSPYKPFPKALNLEHAAFNISISFKKR